MALVYPQIVTGADLLRGITKLNHLAPLLKRRGAKVAAIVNSKMYGVRSFYKVMKKYDIHPVFGLSMHIAIGDDQVLFAYIYAENEIGFQNLLKMSSAVSIRDNNELPLQWLKAYSAGCIVVLAMTHSTWEGARDEETLEQLVAHCTDAVVTVGIERTGGHIHADESEIERVASIFDLKIAAIYEARFLNKEDAFAYEVASAIRFGHKLGEGKTSDHKDAYLPDESELKEWFAGKEHWLKLTETLMECCTATLPERKQLMPIYPVPENGCTDAFLKTRSETGLLNRLGRIDEQYRKRLDYELQTIKQMGYADYFLIVEDFMNYAAQQKILTGPGRGSSAGSLVAFALRITDVDPIQYGLIFERFLNPYRVTMPDIDIDFADNRRTEVINYVANKYGKTNVAQIITFGTLSAKSVARNAARVFGFSMEEIGFLANEIPNRRGITLRKAYEESASLRDWIAMAPERLQWYESALTLEGLPRNASTHAAGVVMSPKSLVDTVPLQDGGDGIYLTQWSMNDVEEQGLLKMDFLGLRNLTLLDRIRAMIAYDKKVHINFEAIPLNDLKTFELFQKGDMTGIFQFESDGMRRTLKLIRPTRFEDLFAINALFRPGPMDNIPLYAKRKVEKEEISYIHPSLAPILEETYGVIVYQEQILQIAVQFANYTFGEADLLRRAISKKNRVVLDEERLTFVSRALANRQEEKIATEIYDLIVKFADYGFPKSHAVAYSLISYRLAFLKANEPAYFYAALLSATTGHNEKIANLIREAKGRGIEVLPPSIGRSKYNYTVEQGRIRMGLSSISGVTRNFYRVLDDARKEGSHWKTIFDFACALGGTHFTVKTVNPLIKAGALDEFGETRAVLLASIDAAHAHALFIHPDNGEDLFMNEFSSIASPKYSPAGDLPHLLKLEYEREVLGFYLSEHPASTIKKNASELYYDISSIDDVPDRTFIKVVGLITEIKRIRTKKGEAMAFVTLQDDTGTLSCTFFPKQYTLWIALLVEKNMIHVEGTIERRKGTLQILVQKTISV